MGDVTSRDGTAIAVEQSGKGPPVVLVDGALCFRRFGSMAGLSRALASHFTVYTYDRRGRGGSGDTLPYAVMREIEDLNAVIAVAGGSANVFGISSGAALVLKASAVSPGIQRLALYDAPFMAGALQPGQVDAYGTRLHDLLSANRRGEAVELFLTSVGTPAQAIAGMRQAPFWLDLEALAPTLAYDKAVLGDGTVPVEEARRVKVPALVMAGGAGPEELRLAAKAIASQIPGAQYRVLEGQRHDVSPEVLARVLEEFFR